MVAVIKIMKTERINACFSVW